MYIKAIVSTLAAWLVGLIIDANLGYGETLGFTMLRVLFPILAMGLCILSEVKKNNLPKDE